MRVVRINRPDAGETLYVSGTAAAIEGVVGAMPCPVDFGDQRAAPGPQPDVCAARTVHVNDIRLIAESLIRHPARAVVCILQVSRGVGALRELAGVDAAQQVVPVVVGIAVRRARKRCAVITLGSRRLLLGQVAQGAVLVLDLACNRMINRARVRAVVPHVVRDRVHATVGMVGDGECLAQVVGNGRELARVVVAALGCVAVAINAAPQAALPVEHATVTVAVSQRDRAVGCLGCCSHVDADRAAVAAGHIRKDFLAAIGCVPVDIAVAVDGGALEVVADPPMPERPVIGDVAAIEARPGNAHHAPAYG
jgi:hypothetical protein